MPFEGCPCQEDVRARCSDIIQEIPECREKTPEEPEDRTSENKWIDENGHAVIPEGTEEIEEHAFENCRGLLSVEIPSSVKVIAWAAFYGCTGLTSVVIPDNVEEIQEYAFGGCTALTEVTLPQNAKIDFEAFKGCPFEEQFLN